MYRDMSDDDSGFPDEDPFPNGWEPPELLMEATVRVLAEEGFRGLTLRKVAEKAEQNRGLVHYYFESKADLLQSLLDHILSGTKRLIRIDDEDSVVDRLWSALRFHAYGPGGIDDAGRHYYMAILQLRALAAHDATIRHKCTRNHQYMVDLVTSIIEEGIEDGTFLAVDPESTAVFLITAIDGARIADLALDVCSARETSLVTIEQFVSKTLLA